MRAKRRRPRPVPVVGDDHPPDATGLTIDWIGVQTTGSGGQTGGCVWIVGVLVALRAAPFVLRGISRRLAAARLGHRSPPPPPPGEA